jgi:uncharacterized protein (TIGR02466 family)
MIEPKFELLFPIPVMFTELQRDFTKKELDAVKKHSKNTYKNAGNVTSKDTYVLENPEFKNIKEKVTESINKYIQTVYKPKYKVEAYVTQSWLNYTNKGEYHHKHEHPNSFISGVIYINADFIKDKITFHKNQYTQLQLEPNSYDIYNSNSWWFNVGTGVIVIFPSSLTHHVEDVVADETRISLAFNTFLKGKLGEKQVLTELINE